MRHARNAKATSTGFHALLAAHKEQFLDRIDKRIMEHGEPIPPESSEPTRFLPGSAQKVAVMKYRVEMGMQPFCSKDAKGAKRV